MFLYIKALHIIFVVTWFAGLFYMPRLFIYFAEANDKPEPEKTILQNQFKVMQRRLWFGITWPSAVLTLMLGTSTWYLYGFTPSWLQIKLLFVLGLFGYHFYCHKIFKQQQVNLITWNSTKLRIWNEVATIFLFAIVFLVILKNALGMIYGLLGLFILIVILLVAIRVYKKSREKK
ncbi:MAG: protoporphyrinogen IX oxidase [Cytophagales bacterium CG18_big_fil_WC_8_21_14_2_50_42_9]|nr:MAG: protoporphyrinogen IX oxidase [Cytophagales bacterium CG18_big_fil_WC_8_21_14_2_50_42_9]